jgi:hypothetical protein
MDVFRMIQIAWRRWYVVVPTCLVGIVAAIVAASSIPPEYSATGTFVVIDQRAGDPRVTSTVLAEAVQDGESRSAVRATGDGGSYIVDSAGEDILRVIATANSRDDAVAVANAVLDQLGPTLQTRRAELGDTSTEPVEILNRPASATQVSVDEMSQTFQAVGSARLLGTGEPAFTGDRASRLLTAVLGDDAIRSEVQGEGDTTYVAETSRDLPTITVQAVGTDAEAVLGTLENLSVVANRELVDLFALAGQDDTSVSAEPLSIPTEAEVDTRGVYRSVIALLALTAAVAVALAFGVEGYTQHRAQQRREDERRRRSEDEQDAGGPSAMDDLERDLSEGRPQAATGARR